MKKAVYWLFGDWAGGIVVGSWSWLWGVDNETDNSDLDTIAAASESIAVMEVSVKRLVDVVSMQHDAYQRARQKYLQKQREFKNAEQLAFDAQHNGQDSTARLAMAKAIQIEKILPVLKGQMQQAEELLNGFQTRLEEERLALETHKGELQNMKDLTEISEVLAAVKQAGQGLAASDAKGRFQDMYSELEERTKTDILASELYQDPENLATAKLSQLELDEEIARRLENRK
ncbi:MAG: PspA/IM30 family protein [Cyanobacteria bacterium P01_A01_bin.3]